MRVTKKTAETVKRSRNLVFPVTMQTDTLVDSWRTWQLAQSLSVRTIGDRTRTIERMALACEVDPREARVDHLATWLATPEWSIATRWTYHQALSAWFLWLQKQGHRQDNPMVLIGKPKKAKGEPHPISDREMSKLLRSDMQRRTRAMVLLAGLAGLRVHEIAAIRGENFDLVERSITFTGKGNLTKTLPLHHLIIEHAYQMPRKGFWFPGMDNGHQHRRSVTNTIKAAMMRAGCKGSAHALRHWFGTSLVAEGVDLRTVQELLRHQSLATTQIYTLVSPAQRADGINRLDPYRGN